ncbi:MAG: thermonuclease family protein [Proteobacteria bacterium]|nr:thermonuclease family protein [Pseudomonadota bacterium]
MRLLPLLALLITCVGPEPPPTYPGGDPACSEQTQVEVLSVTDGDTLRVLYLSGSREGSEDDVRLIGFDTPEVDHSGDDHDCFGLPAWQALIDVIDGELAWLTFDEECSDTYGRALGFLFRDSDGLFVNQHMIREGYGRACPFPPNTTFSDDFSAAEVLARDENLGRWAEPCNGGPECFAGGQ